jgi:hypothetical protein
MQKSNIFARIPLQSPPFGGDSFPSGEALAPAQVNSNLSFPFPLQLA